MAPLQLRTKTFFSGGQFGTDKGGQLHRIFHQGKENYGRAKIGTWQYLMHCRLH